MKKNTLILTAAFLTGNAHATVIISESFNGTGVLNGTAATTFAPGITTAGGSSTWVARDSDVNHQFLKDGSVVLGGTQQDAAAYLLLGSYIDDAKGTATGKFTLTTTFAAITGGQSTANSTFITTGFFNTAIPTDSPFFASPAMGDAYGLSTAITRKNGASTDTDYFVGPGSTNSRNAIDGRGARAYTIVLDFTPAGGYNGIDDFGTVTFFSDNGPALGNTYDILANYSYAAVGITVNDSANTTISNFTLSQVPEPSALLLGTLGSLFLLRRKR